MTTLSPVADYYRPKIKQSVWEWAGDNVDFSLNPLYPAARDGRYDPEWLPFFKEPADAVQDPVIREVVFLKCSQAGATENLLLNPLRYAVARQPVPVLYVAGQQEQTEAFMLERVKGGLKCAVETSRKLRKAQERGNEIYFADMIVACTWARSSQGLKSRPVGMVLADEISIWPENALDRLRKRVETYPFPVIVIVSAPDPNTASSSDPIFSEFAQGDQRYWMMTDPDTGNLFRFEMGWKQEGMRSAHGLRWDENAKQDDGSWDLEHVRSSAHYVTPDGTRIESDQKFKVVAGGQWISTNPNASATKRSYHLNAFYLPWFSFGDVALAFLDTNARGAEALRVFVNEWLAEPWAQTVDSPVEDEISRCQSVYKSGERYSLAKETPEDCSSIVLMSVDVQKDHFWWVVREWLEGGTSGLISWGRAFTYADIDEIARKHDASRVFIDSGYNPQTGPVYQACLHLKMIATKGYGRQLSEPLVQRVVDPWEGRRSGDPDSVIARLDFDANIFKTLLMDLIKGRFECSWFVYGAIEREYCLQLTSEEKTENGWSPKRGMDKRNHLWDCEVIQVVGATRFGFFNSPQIPDEIATESEPVDAS